MFLWTRNETPVGFPITDMTLKDSNYAFTDIHVQLKVPVLYQNEIIVLIK